MVWVDVGESCSYLCLCWRASFRTRVCRRGFASAPPAIATLFNKGHKAGTSVEIINKHAPNGPTRQQKDTRHCERNVLGHECDTQHPTPLKATHNRRIKLQGCLQKCKQQPWLSNMMTSRRRIPGIVCCLLSCFMPLLRAAARENLLLSFLQEFLRPAALQSSRGCVFCRLTSLPNTSWMHAESLDSSQFRLTTVERPACCYSESSTLKIMLNLKHVFIRFVSVVRVLLCSNPARLGYLRDRLHHSVRVSQESLQATAHSGDTQRSPLTVAVHLRCVLPLQDYRRVPGCKYFYVCNFRTSSGQRSAHNPLCNP